MADVIIATEDEDGKFIEVVEDDDGVGLRYEDEDDAGICCCCAASACPDPGPHTGCRCLLDTPLTITVTVSGTTGTCVTKCHTGGTVTLWGRADFNGTLVLERSNSAGHCGWGYDTGAAPVDLFPRSFFTNGTCTTAGGLVSETASGTSVFVGFISPPAGTLFQVYYQQYFFVNPCPGGGTTISDAPSELLVSGIADWDCCETLVIDVPGGGTITIEACGGEESGAAEEEWLFYV